MNMVRDKNTVQNSFELNINGTVYTVNPDVSPTTTLLQYLREFASLKGTKGLCYEGGCGVCTVAATFIDQETGKEKTCCVKSCQTLLYSCAGWVVETVENLGNQFKGLDPLQKALVGFCGSQCGFCSPGFLMTMYGEMKGNGKMTQQQVENCLDGSLCRCTGYRPILDAFKSLASDAPKYLLDKIQDIEESYKALCPKTGELCHEKCSSDTPDSSQCPSAVPLSTKGLRTTFGTMVTAEGITWEKPTTLTSLYEILKSFPADKTLRMVVGNTGEGVYKSENTYDAYVDLTSVKDLYSVTVGKPLVVGANVSLHRCIQVFREMANQTGYKYLEQIANHWENVANTSIRHVGSWAGNLMIKQQHKDFPSDIFVCLAAVDAMLKIGNSTDSSTSDVRVEKFMDLDMSKSVILSMSLPPFDENIFIRTYKISPRAVNAHAIVNAGFKFQVDSKNGFKLLSKPSIVYGGINPTFIHADKTEAILDAKNLSDDTTIQAAMGSLANEILPDSNPADPSPTYRVALTQSLLYKAILNILGNEVNPKFMSGGTSLVRPLSSGRQSFDQNKDTWPIGQGMPKVEANVQVSGEAEYVDDIEPVKGELFGAFVQSTMAKAKLDVVDATSALKVPGVVAFFGAKDIPGTNSYYPAGHPDTIFVATDVEYAGQSIGLVVATSRDIAIKAAKLVKVTYKNILKPVLAMKDVIMESPFEPITDDLTDNVLQGEFEQGTQFHFQLEPIAVRVIPVEDGYNIDLTTQWPTGTQTVVSQVLGINSNRINISVRRIGGGFGGKISRPIVVAAAAAVAAHKLQKPVRVTLDLQTHMTLVGWRDPYYTKYQVAFDNAGLLKGVDLRLIADAGYNSNETSANYIYEKIPNVYYSPKWMINTAAVTTDSAPNTPCRSPGIPEAIASMENVIERIAYFLKKDPIEIREKNFIDMSKPNDQPFKPKGENLVRTKIFPMMKEQASYAARKAEIQKFNETNRWMKRGISMLPLYYSFDYPGYFKYNTHVAIYASDGSVVITHGCIEMGQGLNTKAIQVAAKLLNVPMELIKVKPTNLVTGMNSALTGGSYGSDLLCHGVQKCCSALRKRMDVVSEAMVKKNKVKPTWQQLAAECLNRNVDLSEKFWTNPSKEPKPYDIFATVCMEVEIDVLTGQYMILRTDIIEDCGRSINPLVDVGQIEGALIMGFGMYTCEEVKFDPKNGQKVSCNTWTYKIPSARDIPTDFRVTLLPKGDNTQGGVVRSKGVGEPAVCFTYIVVTALREAIASARSDAGFSDWFEMSTPMTVERVQLLCKNDPNSFLIKGKKRRNLSSEDEDFHIVDTSKDLLSIPLEQSAAGCSLH